MYFTDQQNCAQRAVLMFYLYRDSTGVYEIVQLCEMSVHK